MARVSELAPVVPDGDTDIYVVAQGHSHRARLRDLPVSDEVGNRLAALETDRHAHANAAALAATEAAFTVEDRLKLDRLPVDHRQPPAGAALLAEIDAATAGMGWRRDPPERTGQIVNDGEGGAGERYIVGDADGVTRIARIARDAYLALAEPDPRTLYVIHE